MSYDTLREVLSERMIAEWSGTSLDRVVHGDNRSPLSIDDGPWVRLSYSITSNVNAEIGTGFQRASGIITVQIFTEEKAGEKQSLDLVDGVAAVFQNKNFNRVECFATYPLKIVRTGNNT